MNTRRSWRKRLLAAHRFLRTRWMVLRALVSTRHVVLAHLIPIRRCNLSCAYCNEYDRHSAPVPLAELQRRIDVLASFGTSIITLSGGEPLLHPDLDEVIRHIRRHGIIAGLITNGYLLTRERIERLNRAGLEFLQISIDNVQPDEVSKKSLKVLDRKLELLAEFAEFHVNINSVLGSGVRRPEDALVIARRAVELGFTSTVGILHDEHGQLKPLGEREREIFAQVLRLGKRSFARINGFQRDIVAGREHRWRCRAGARYLYVCEDGLVHYCSQQRGYPGIPLEQYTEEMRRREFYTRKGCAPRCTISCVQQVAVLDNWRAPQTLEPLPRPTPAGLVQLSGTGSAR